MKTDRSTEMMRLLALCICATLATQTARAEPSASACDMNDDGRYGITDLLAVHRACKSDGFAASADSLTCDMNGDGRYSVADLLAIDRFCKTPPPVAGQRLNDTGIDWCAYWTRNFLPCPVDGYPEQDAQSGRDATNDDSDGHAGFSFTKLDGNGNPLSADATLWSCVRDDVTGLTWEIKTDDGGLRDEDWTYTWYNSDPVTNGGDAGTHDGGTCGGGVDRDTDAVVQAVNQLGLCGSRDWRLPRRSELMSSEKRTVPETRPA
jgi:hypothetical protein